MSPVASSFGERLAATFDARGRLCVGIDPHEFLLNAWGLGSDAAGVREFGLRVVDAAAGAAGIVKPQVAFFERFGSAGYAALEEVIAAARSAGLLVIADAKRGDIGTSIDAYAAAWLTPGASLEVDAMTVSAFQGVGSLDSTIDRAVAGGKGLLVLAATSNPQAAAIQSASVAGDAADGVGRTVARVIIDDVTRTNERLGDAGSAPIGSFGVVLGATIDLREFGIEIDAPRPTIPVLGPGFGSQGARVDTARERYGVFAEGLIVSESRSILTAGPDGIAGAVASRATEVRSALG